MFFSFERLESRDLLTTLRIDFDGPTIVSAGDEVAYSFGVTNRQTVAVNVRPDFRRVPLQQLEWTLDDHPWVSSDSLVELDPKQTVVFEATGRVPSGNYFVLSPWFAHDDSGSSIGLEVSVHILDADEHTIGSTIHHYTGQSGFRLTYFLAGHVTAITPDDVDPDGLTDINVDFLHWVDDARQTARFTLKGTRTRNVSYVIESDDLILRESRTPTNVTIDFFNREPQLYGVGDVDGDGYQDMVRTDVAADRATILFGPDYRENFVILGRPQIGQPDGNPRFGLAAGPVGDFNGDGYEDYFVFDRYDINVFYGRDFGRNPTGDVNRDGTVNFDDFRILAENFDRETNDRALGELDGDGRVTFLDFLLLAENFGKSA